VKHIIETALLGKRFRRTAGYRDLLLSPFRREEITAVQDASLQVQEGELFGLLGPNGAGKTTLIKMLCTLILPSAGAARVGGHDVVTEAEQVRELVGLVNCDERSFFWRLTGRQNLEFFAALYDVHHREAQRRIEEVLLLVELTEHADQRFDGYSTGMRQRLAIARGLLRMPPILFMDEPTRSLDPINARSLRAFIREQLVDTLGRTVVLVTHRLEEAEELCDRIAVMNEGRIVACGSAAELKNRTWAERVYELEVQDLSPEAVDGLHAVRGVASCRLDKHHA
jgi:ABC-2 type transport system ATP-binding protein